MAATVEIDEANGAGTITHGITNSNYGSADGANLVAVDNPITPVAGTYAGSFEKYQRLHVTSLAGVSQLKNVKLWRHQGSPTSGDLHKTTATPTAASYTSAVFATPTTALMSGATVHDMPSSEPASANVGINSSHTLAISNLGTNSVSDYVKHQVQISAGTTSGATLTLRWSWDEIS